MVEDHKVRTRIKAALAGALKRGESKEQFFKNMQSTFDQFKLGSAKQLETVFTTNTALAYGAGQQKAIIEHQDFFPYWQYVAVMDGRTRDAHAALNGKIFKASDHAFYPPIGFNCRCTAIPLTEEEAHQEITQNPSTIKTPQTSSLSNAEFVGNKQLNFIKWLKNEYTTLEPASKLFIDKAIQELTASTKTIITTHREQVKLLSKKAFAGKVIKTSDDKDVFISNTDIKTIASKGHKDLFAKNNLLKRLDDVLKESTLVEIANEHKGRSQYKRWYYYKYKNGFYLNIVELITGEFRLHAITDVIK